MRSSPGICKRKRRYTDEPDALAVAERADISLRPYRCSVCDHWHLTSRTKGMKLPAFELARRKASQEG